MLPGVEEEAKTATPCCVAQRGRLTERPEARDAPTIEASKPCEGWQSDDEKSCAVVGWGSALIFNAMPPHSGRTEQLAPSVREISATHSFLGVTKAYFEAEVVQRSHKLSALLVGFSPANSTAAISSGVFFDMLSHTVWLNGEVLPPSAWLSQTQRQAIRQVNEESRLVVGAGVDMNGRVFFTVNGRIACVPLTFNPASHGADHHCNIAAEARGHPVRLLSSWTKRTVVARVLTDPARSSVQIETPIAGSDHQRVDALVMCNSDGDSSARPFEFFAANQSPTGKECDVASSIFASVSQWLACTGWSPLADRVVIPRGQLPTECALPHCSSRGLVAGNRLTAKSSLFRGAPCFAPFSWESIFQDGPEGRAAKVSREATARVYKDITYHIMHTGGFVRLCTARGRALWMAQNATGHLSPDWKLHFSVALEDIPHVRSTHLFSAT